MVTVVGVILLGAAPANAAFGVSRFDGQVINRDAGGTAVAATQAGSHPAEVSTTIDFRTVRDPALSSLFGTDTFIPDESVRDIFVDLPVGFIGNPTAAAQCTDPQLASDTDPQTECPADSQVGIASVESAVQTFVVPIFNMVPPPGVPGAFGFRVGGVVPVHLRARVRSDSDYGLSIDLTGINQALPITRTTLTFWGVPASPSHDSERKGGPTAATQRAFFTNPTQCNGPVQTKLRVTSWNGSTDQSSFFTHLLVPDENQLIGPENCDKLPFDITLSASPQSTRASDPSGYSFDISVPQSDVPGALAQAHLKKAVVTLPQGVSLSPSAASGLGACADADTALGQDGDPTCPDASKVGTMTIDTPLLEDQMRGSVYLRQPKPGNLIRLLLVAHGPGVVVKLPGDVQPDPTTGQLTATFDNNPQLPFSNLHLEFKSGPRAALINPPRCGTYTTTAELTSWSGKTVRTSSRFDATRDGRGAACPPRAFTPDFFAGLVNPTGGLSSTFALTFARDGENPTLRDITVDLPEGLTGKIADATLCSEAQAATATCGEGSRIGSTTTGAGAGTNPFFLPGRVYITGPYNGAPYGMSIVVPAIAGPFDLGTVVVRAAIFVDRTTAKLRVVSDPLPTILEGVPLLVRSVNIQIDRAGFILAPTNCKASSIDARIGSNEGLGASVRSRFQVGNCSALRFAPKMTLKVGARGKLTRGKRTPLDVTLTMPKGNANNKSVQVTLPKTLNARLDVVNKRRACSIEQFNADRCPMSVGTGTAVTPLLRDPLSGPAYFVYNPARRLPDLVVRLKGQVNVDLTGKVTITRDLKLQTMFDTVPDVPITKFRLSLASGGTNGPVGLTRNLCLATTRRDLKAKLALTAQSGKKVARDQPISVAGCARKRARGSRAARSRRAARANGSGRDSRK